jgi:hypothetical protein
MADETMVLLDLKVNADQALKNIADLTKANAELRKEIDAVKATEKEAGGATEETIKQRTQLNAKIKENNAGIRENVKELKVQSAEVATSEGSINSMRSRLRELNSAYASMSKEMRESEIGQKVAGEMKILNESVNDASLKVSNFKDNIGNYPDVMQGITQSNTLVGRSMQTLGITANTTAGAFGKQMVGALQAVGMQMKALMANPLIAGIAIILGVIMAIVEAIKRNDEALTAIQVAFAPIQQFVDYIFKAIGFIAEGVAKAVEWIMTLGGQTETAGQKAVKMMDLIEDKRRDLVKQEAEDQTKLSEAREIASDKENYSAEERKKALLDAKKIQEDLIKQKEDLAKMELKQFQLANINNNNTDEYEDKEAEMEAKITALKGEQADINRTLLRQMNGINKELKAQEEAEKKLQEERLKIWRATQEERKKIQAKVEKDLQDLMLAMMKEGEQKEIASIKLQGERKLEELRLQLATEKNLTAKAKNDLQNTIKLQEEKLQSDINAIVDRYANEREANEQAIKDKAEADNTAKELQRQADASALKLEQRRLELENELAFELEQEQIKNDALLELKKEGNEELLLAQFGTMEAYELAVLQSNEKLKASNQAVVNSQKNQQMKMLASIGQIAGSMSDLFGSIAGDSKALASFQKAMGMVEIMTNMAIGISKAVGKTGGEPFSLSLLITSIVGGITSAIGILSKTQDPPIPSRLSDTGGGGGSAPTMTVPSISIPTTSVNPTLAMNASRQSESQAGQTDATMSAITQMPAPEVKVVEITQGINAVAVKENKSTF